MLIVINYCTINAKFFLFPSLFNRIKISNNFLFFFHFFFVVFLDNYLRKVRSYPSFSYNFFFFHKRERESSSTQHLDGYVEELKFMSLLNITHPPHPRYVVSIFALIFKTVAPCDKETCLAYCR